MSKRKKNFTGKTALILKRCSQFSLIMKREIQMVL